MIPQNRLFWLHVLQLGLGLSAAGWGISFYFTFSSWDAAVDRLGAMGARPISYQPLLEYWMRMASAAFGCIGIASLCCCLRPQEFKGLIRLLGLFHGFVGAVLAVTAWRGRFTYRSEPTFIPDISFCVLVAVLVQLPQIAARRAEMRLEVSGGHRGV